MIIELLAKELRLGQETGYTKGEDFSLSDEQWRDLFMALGLVLMDLDTKNLAGGRRCATEVGLLLRRDARGEL